MKTRDAIGAYLKSPLALISALVCLLGGGAGLAFAGGSFLLGMAGGVFLWLGFSVISIQSPSGAKALLAVRDREGQDRVENALSQAAESRERLRRLRISDPEIAATVEYLIQCAGEYLDAGKKNQSHSPEADARIADSLDSVNLYLKELDEAATERRYKLSDSDPFVDAKARVKAILVDDARVIREQRILIDGGLPPEAQLRAKEEIR